MRYFKIINRKKGNNNWMYFIGIHDLKDNNEEFNTSKECGKGGLYYTTLEFILEFLSYGDMLCEVIPLGQIIDMEYKFKTNRLEIISMIPLDEISTWEFMRENGCPLNESVCLWAVKNNNFEILKWARENECLWNESVCAYAAKNNNLEMLKWARENGCPWNESVCYWAAENNNFKILKWARENECPWDEYVCYWIAKNNNLEMLKWARENGCPWDERVYYWAKRHNNFEMLNWMVNKF